MGPMMGPGVFSSCLEVELAVEIDSCHHVLKLWDNSRWMLVPIYLGGHGRRHDRACTSWAGVAHFLAANGEARRGEPREAVRGEARGEICC